MNTTPDYTAAGDGGSFDPAQAAALLDQTTQQTRRKIAPAQPWLLAIRAVAVLLVLGACWLNVRGQHPYTGPTASVLPFVWGFVILNFAATVGIRMHATAGVSGRSRFRPAEIAVLTLAWLAVLPLIAALHHAGVSNAEAYSLVPLTVPLIFAGLTYAAVGAARGEWRPFGVGLGVAVTGAVGLLAGPVGSWAVDGFGLCLVLLGSAAAVVWGDPPQRGPAMTEPQRDPAMTGELDPLIHVPTRLKIVATLAALPDGDTLSFTRLQDLLGLTPGNLIIQLRKLEEAGYLSTEKTRSGSTQKTTVALTRQGRKALDEYTQALRGLLGGL